MVALIARRELGATGQTRSASACPSFGHLQRAICFNARRTQMNKHNRSILSLAVTVLAGLAFASPRPASAQIIYATNFDNPPFVAGLPLVGQGEWVAPPPLSPNAAIISSDQPRQG